MTEKPSDISLSDNKYKERFEKLKVKGNKWVSHCQNLEKKNVELINELHSLVKDNDKLCHYISLYKEELLEYKKRCKTLKMELNQTENNLHDYDTLQEKLNKIQIECKDKEDKLSLYKHKAEKVEILKGNKKLLDEKSLRLAIVEEKYNDLKERFKEIQEENRELRYGLQYKKSS